MNPFPTVARVVWIPAFAGMTGLCVNGYNNVNAKLGYPQIDIRTPYEVINDRN